MFGFEMQTQRGVRTAPRSESSAAVHIPSPWLGERNVLQPMITVIWYVEGVQHAMCAEPDEQFLLELRDTLNEHFPLDRYPAVQNRREYP